jgi:hypothetical protein
MNSEMKKSPTRDLGIASPLPGLAMTACGDMSFVYCLYRFDLLDFVQSDAQ